MIPFFAAWAGHTEMSREMAGSLDRAIDAHGIKHETVARVMKLSREDLAKQRSGQKPLNLWRLGYVAAELPAVYLSFLGLEARRFGASLITAEDRAFVANAAQVGRKRMARMVPQLFDSSEERRVG